MDRLPKPQPAPPTTSPRPVAAGMDAHAAEAAALLRVLANEQRLLILCHLAPGESAVGELGERLSASAPPLSQSALSQHLAVLREAGLVTSRREGQRIYYAIAPGPASDVMATLHAVYCGEDA